MSAVPAHEMREGKVYRPLSPSRSGDLLLVTRVERLEPALRMCHTHDGHDACYSDGEAASVRFVWLGSDDPEVAARYIGHEHRFTARAQVPHYYEEL